MFTYSHSIGLAFGVLGVTLILSACGESNDQTHAEPPLGPAVTVTEYNQISLPLDSYELDLQQSVQVDNAVNILLNDCMQQLGYPAKQFPLRDVTGQVTSHGRLYGILDEEAASKYGYHPVEYNDVSKQKEDNSGEDPWSSPEAIRAIGHTEISNDDQETKQFGCIGEARTQIQAGGPPFDLYLPERLKGESFARHESDSRVEAAYAAWSTCMEDSGFDYASPRDANNDDRWNTEKASEAEVATAVADVKCKHETNLAGIRMAVETAYQEILIEEHAEALVAIREGHERMLRSASEIVADG